MAASPLSPLSAQILPIRNQNDEDGSLSSSSNDSSFCPPFANDEALDAYVSSIDVMFDGKWQCALILFLRNRALSLTLVWLVPIHEPKLASIAPPRELICPITQELLRDPVLCSDGHTYERSSLVTWFSMGRNRSPVTNSLLEDTSIERLVPNLAVGSMATLHREKLGKKLIHICEGVNKRGGRCDDGGVRIEGLVDAGADVSGRGSGGNTPLHLVSFFTP